MQSFEIRFSDVGQDEANLLAQGLEEALSNILDQKSVSRSKDRADTQDFGSTLILVLGTPVAVVVAKAISDFLKRNSGATIEIRSNGHVVAKNLDSGDTVRIAEAFAPVKKERE